MTSPTNSSLSSSYSLKKDADVMRLEDAVVMTKDSSQLYNPHVDVSSVDERALIRKIDMRTIPWLSFLYLLCFLDRTSIGNAKLYNMETALHLTDTQYLLCLTIFFVSYAIFEVPSNIVLKRLRPSRWLSTLMVGWGIMMTVQGLVHNFSGLMAMRWLLGMFEAGLYPGVTYYLSCWYKRSEFGIRAAIFFSAATVSGAFGGLLGAAISNMNGVGGKPAWAWIFILEGLVTIIAGAVSFWIIVDFPDDAKFLTEEERTAVIRRLQGDDQFSAAGEKLKWKYIKASLTEWKTYVAMFVCGGITMPMYAFALFLPSIINELGYKATSANLLTVPVYAVACTCTCTVGFLADRYGNRGLFNLACLCVALTGYIILVASRDAKLSYFAVYLAACGIFPCSSNTTAWVCNNVEGSYKRSVSLAMVISWSNIQGIVSSNVYRANQKPWYPLGHGLVLMYIVTGLIATLTLRYILKKENDRRDRGERDELIEGMNGGHEGNGRYSSVEEAKREKGDNWSGYRYTL
ncbi:major facilitator superfamily domain-containing protein [Pisolithus marmoratus]|nr:major facilitator superfamily domain-containing protein [Pisolithus marmoratus]